MTKIDEAVESACVRWSGALGIGSERLDIFHRALRERGYVVVPQYLITTMREFLAAGDDSLTAGDDTAAMLRFGETQDRLRAMLEAVK